MTDIRNYTAEITSVRSILESYKIRARAWSRPELWLELHLRLVNKDGYYVVGRIASTGKFVTAGGAVSGPCWGCSGVWPENPCDHQLGLAALWAGGHPIAQHSDWDPLLEIELERG